MIAFMIAVAAAGLGAAHLVRLAIPPRPDLVADIGQWELARARATARHAISAQQPRSVTERLATRLAEAVSRGGRDLTSGEQDLAIVGVTLEGFLSKTLSLVLAALLAPPALFTAFGLLGLDLPVASGLAAGLVLSVGVAAGGLRELRADAGKRRSELRRALSIYLDLVAMSMEAGRGHAEALPASAAIGTGWTFTLIQDAIESARYSGTTPWAELGALGRRVGMTELIDLEAALELAHDDGAKVKASLVARAGTLRAQRVADNEAKANQATDSMKLALTVMVATFLAYELYPALARLFTG